MTEIADFITGPNGGIMALCFMVGVSTGYAFAMKTIISEAKKRIAALEAKVEKLQAELLTEARAH